MNLKRTTIIFVSGAALAAWLSAAMTPGRPPAPSIAIAPSPIDARGAALASEITRLRERLRPSSAPGTPVRNPFTFGSSRRTSLRSTQATERSAPPVVTADVAGAQQDAAIRLTLAGIAEDPGPDGPIRTAIVSGNGQVFLVKDGDTVSDRGVVYKIGTISADSVELIDLRDGTARRLALR